jgi:hypothetical protein
MRKKFMNRDEVTIGMVVNMGGSDEPFSDCVVLSFDHESELYTLVRPYLFISGVQTACPSPLMGFERFTVSWSSLQERFEFPVSDRGETRSFIT